MKRTVERGWGDADSTYLFGATSVKPRRWNCPFSVNVSHMETDVFLPSRFCLNHSLIEDVSQNDYAPMITVTAAESQVIREAPLSQLPCVFRSTIRYQRL